MTTTFTGEVRIPGSIENGLPSTITLDAQTLILTAGGTELGRWNRNDLKLRREPDGSFHLTLGREVVLFNPDSPLEFAILSGMPGAGTAPPPAAAPAPEAPAPVPEAPVPEAPAAAPVASVPPVAETPPAAAATPPVATQPLQAVPPAASTPSPTAPPPAVPQPTAPPAAVPPAPAAPPAAVPPAATAPPAAPSPATTPPPAAPQPAATPGVAPPPAVTPAPTTPQPAGAAPLQAVPPAATTPPPAATPQPGAPATAAVAAAAAVPAPTEPAPAPPGPAEFRLEDDEAPISPAPENAAPPVAPPAAPPAAPAFAGAGTPGATGEFWDDFRAEEQAAGIDTPAAEQAAPIVAAEAALESRAGFRLREDSDEAATDEESRVGGYGSGLFTEDDDKPAYPPAFGEAGEETDDPDRAWSYYDEEEDAGNAPSVSYDDPEPATDDDAPEYSSPAADREDLVVSGSSSRIRGIREWRPSVPSFSFGSSDLGMRARGALSVLDAILEENGTEDIPRGFLIGLGGFAALLGVVALLVVLFG